MLDLDNTLWGGVVGETGPLGVALGEAPDGEAFRAFQKHCKELARRGVVLAVASKNNPADAREPFETNPDMVLTLDDFAAFEIGWEPKGTTIARLAADPQPRASTASSSSTTTRPSASRSARPCPRSGWSTSPRTRPSTSGPSRPASGSRRPA